MKKPEEIKKELAVCATVDGDCENSPYDDRTQLVCVDRLRKDSISRTKRLESAAEFYRSKAEMLESRLAQAEREMDALMFDLKTAIYRGRSFNLDCEFCKDKDKPVCESCEWEWRGVCPENSP